jgi:hypothetical protein
MTQLEKLPIISSAVRHPRLAAWIVLSVGMVILLVIEAREIGLLATQWLALIVACVLVAGLCVWIISWESDDEDADDGVQAARLSDESVKSDKTDGPVTPAV